MALPEKPIRPASGDPFASVRGKTRTWDRAYHTGALRLDGRPIARGRSATFKMQTELDLPVYEWFLDRAAILDVGIGALVRDILVLWRGYVLAEEAERGIDYDAVPANDVSRTALVVPERRPGYAEKLEPRGGERSHLDSSPLGLEELI